MPQDHKTSINNLIIVWQGSSWSVIAPNGTVLARFFEKYVAVDFARSMRDYASEKYRPYSGDVYYDRSSTSSFSVSPYTRKSNSLELDLKWLHRHEIFRTDNEGNPPFFIGISVESDRNNFLLVARTDKSKPENTKLMYINPALVQPDDMPMFRLDIIRYGKIPSTIQVLGRPTYFEDMDTIYAAAGETQLDASGLEDQQRRKIEIETIYRRRNGQFYPTRADYELDFDHWLTEFITRAEKGKSAIDHRKETWDDKPTIYGLFVNQRKINQNDSQSNYKKPKRK